MRKIIFFTIVLMSTFGQITLAQEAPPPSQYLKSVNAQFYLDTRDSSVWHFKGSIYGWAKLGRYKDVEGKLNASDTTLFLKKNEAVTSYAKLVGGNLINGLQYFSNGSTQGLINGSRFHGEAGYIDVGVNTELFGGLNRTVKIRSGASGKYVLARGDSLSDSQGNIFIKSDGNDANIEMGNHTVSGYSGLNRYIIGPNPILGELQITTYGADQVGVTFGSTANGAYIRNFGNGKLLARFANETGLGKLLLRQGDVPDSTTVANTYLRKAGNISETISGLKTFNGIEVQNNNFTTDKIGFYTNPGAAGVAGWRFNSDASELTLRYQPSVGGVNRLLVFNQAGGGPAQGGYPVAYTSDLNDYIKKTGGNYVVGDQTFDGNINLTGTLTTGNDISANNISTNHIGVFNSIALGLPGGQALQIVHDAAGFPSQVEIRNTAGSNSGFKLRADGSVYIGNTSHPVGTDGVNVTGKNIVDSDGKKFLKDDGTGNFQIMNGKSITFHDADNVTYGSIKLLDNQLKSAGSFAVGGDLVLNGTYSLNPANVSTVNSPGAIDANYYSLLGVNNYTSSGVRIGLGGTTPYHVLLADSAGASPYLSKTGDQTVAGKILATSFKTSAGELSGSSLFLQGGYIDANFTNDWYFQGYDKTHITTSNPDTPAQPYLMSFNLRDGSIPYNKSYVDLRGDVAPTAPNSYVRQMDITNRPDSTTISNTYLAKSGGIMTGWVTLPSANPTDPLHAAPKAYIDNAITGITWKNAVRVKTTGNITLSGTQTIDGISVAAGNRVLVNSQTDQTQNGIYVVAAGTWTRPTDADSGDELWTSTVAVTAGTQNRNTQWTCLNTSAPTVGSDAITYGQISGAGTYAASSGISLTANVFTLDQSFTRGLFSATGPLTYNSATGTFGIPQASGSQDGYLSSANWTTFNNKQNAITLTAGQIGYSNGSTLVGSSSFLYDAATANLTLGGGGAADANAVLKVAANATNEGMVVGTSAYPSWMGTNGLFVDGSFRAGNYFVGSGQDIKWGASQVRILGYNPSSGSDTYLSFYTGGIATNGERLRITDNGNFGFLTSAPTHTITLGSGSTGLALYRTANQTTDYERVLMGWSGTTFQIQSDNLGAGVTRNLAFGAGASTMTFSSAGINNSAIEFKRDNSAITTIMAVNSAGLTGTSVQNAFAIYPTINQSNAATGGYTGLFISPYEQSLGTGTKYLINAGTNTAANGGGTHTSKFSVDNAGAIISPSTGSHLFYNTADQVTNYERVRHYWSSNTYVIGSESGGTGAGRTIQINAAATQLNVQQSGLNFQGNVEVRRDNTSTNTLFGVGSTGLTASAGVQAAIGVYPTINQSGTAGYRAIWVSALETATGSGNKYLIDLGTNTAANAQGTHLTKFTVDNNGNTVIAGALTSGGRRAAVSSVKTANYSALFSDEIIPCNSTAGSFNVTLLSTAPIGSLITVDNTDGTTNSVTVVGTINGVTNYTLNATKTVTLYKTATGTNTWKIRFSN